MFSTVQSLLHNFQCSNCPLDPFRPRLLHSLHQLEEVCKRLRWFAQFHRRIRRMWSLLLVLSRKYIQQKWPFFSYQFFSKHFKWTNFFTHFTSFPSIRKFSPSLSEPKICLIVTGRTVFNFFCVFCLSSLKVWKSIAAQLLLKSTLITSFVASLPSGFM